MTPISRRAEQAIFSGVGRVLNAGVLSHTIYREVGRVRFYVDHGMTLQNGVLGAVRWFTPLEVRLAPIVHTELDGRWKRDRMGGIASSIGLVIHELTHIEQMTWWWGAAWPLLNMPIVCDYTLERWATQNQRDTEAFLLN